MSHTTKSFSAQSGAMTVHCSTLLNPVEKNAKGPVGYGMPIHTE